MHVSRHTMLSVDVVLIIFTTLLFCFGASGHSRAGDEEEEETGNKPPGAYGFQITWLGKRMSQMSCHCCSNSFNSHCCLQCMRSVGKRGDAGASIDLLGDVPEDTGERLVSPVISIPNEAKNDRTLLCFCCILQMGIQSSSGLWSCCDKCPNRLHWIDKFNVDAKDNF
ncbi:hypothetical protein BsWGS_04798 [Bradybaena similaris]